MTQENNKKKLSDSVLKLIKEFQILSFDNKKKKLLNVIEAINYETESFKEVKDAILNNPFVNDEFLDGIYTDIMSFADAIEKGNKKKAMESLQNSQNYITQLHKKEAKEKEKENLELEDMIGELGDKGKIELYKKSNIKIKEKNNIGKIILIFILIIGILIGLYLFLFLK